MKKISLGTLAVAISISFGSPSVGSTLGMGLLAWYPFDGNANDESGNGNDGTVSNANLTQDRNGDLNSAYEFNGTNSVIDIGNGLKPALPHTINLWFNTTEDGYTPLFRNDSVDAGSTRYGSFLSLSNDRSAFIQHFSGFSVFSTRYGVGTDPGVFDFGEWNMLTAITGGPGEARLFLNGVEANVTATTGTGTGFQYSGSSGALGHVQATNGNLNAFERTSFDGLLDDVGVWDRVLTDDEITMLFNGADPLASPLTPVPLPAGFPLLLAGIGALAWVRRLRTPC